MSEYISSKERAKVIKKELSKVYPDNSVKKGTGTASSWVECHIYVSRPENCACEFKTTNWKGETVAPYRNSTYCESCKALHNEVYENGKKLSNQAMKNAGYEHSTYYADDNSNSEHSEFLLQVSVK